MRAYEIRPTFDVYDGTGRLSAPALEVLHQIAEMVADALRAGGDESHQATVWDPPAAFVRTGTPPTLIAAGNRATMVSLVRRLLDPNDFFGGDIRSAVNCRAAVFGQDGQAFLCLRYDEIVPPPPVGMRILVTEEPSWLSQTDIFDGGWPHT